MRTILPANNNPVLREIAREIPISELPTKRIQNLVREMKTLLKKKKYCVALAAPQVGESLRLFIVLGRALARRSRSAPDEPERRRDEATPHRIEPTMPDQVYINPEFIKISRGKKEKHEGCLSVRGKWGTVPRAEKAAVRAYDEHGQRFTRGASGFLAHIFQHEIDHLQGILYTDKATKLYDEKSEKEK